jgi:hypothetical protein
MYARVLDGHGYYDGTFRQVRSVGSKERPDCIQQKDFSAYDQGLGRSLWYSNKGDIQKIKNTIQSFPADRQKHLWRGIGIASVFVGKCDATSLQMLMESAGNYKIQLAIGASIVAKARTETKTFTQDVENACRIWCTISADQARKLVAHAELINEDQEDAYNLWLNSLEAELSTRIWNLS